MDRSPDILRLSVQDNLQHSLNAQFSRFDSDLCCTNDIKHAKDGGLDDKYLQFNVGGEKDKRDERNRKLKQVQTIMVID